MVLAENGAESGALGAREASFDPRLAEVVEAWPGLSEDVRERIVAIAVDSQVARDLPIEPHNA